MIRDYSYFLELLRGAKTEFKRGTTLLSPNVSSWTSTDKLSDIASSIMWSRFLELLEPAKRMIVAHGYDAETGFGYFQGGLARIISTCRACDDIELAMRREVDRLRQQDYRGFLGHELTNEFDEFSDQEPSEEEESYD